MRKVLKPVISRCGMERRTSAMLRVVAIVPALDVVKVGEGLNDCRISALGLFREKRPVAEPF